MFGENLALEVYVFGNTDMDKLSSPFLMEEDHELGLSPGERIL